jgi:hypothetical protein
MIAVLFFYLHFLPRPPPPFLPFFLSPVLPSLLVFVSPTPPLDRRALVIRALLIEETCLGYHLLLLVVALVGSYYLLFYCDFTSIVISVVIAADSRLHWILLLYRYCIAKYNYSTTLTGIGR